MRARHIVSGSRSAVFTRADVGCAGTTSFSAGSWTTWYSPYVYHHRGYAENKLASTSLRFLWLALLSFLDSRHKSPARIQANFNPATRSAKPGFLPGCPRGSRDHWKSVYNEMHPIHFFEIAVHFLINDTGIFLQYQVAGRIHINASFDFAVGSISRLLPRSAVICPSAARTHPNGQTLHSIPKP